jgi:hypothetical protein
MKAILVILLGAGILAGTRAASRTSLAGWAPGTSEDFWRATRAFCLVWFTAMGAVLVAAGLWILLSPTR